jgi:hypothetical protein
LLCRTVSYCTLNKTLVPEWPTFTDVYSFTVSYISTDNELNSGVMSRLKMS